MIALNSRTRATSAGRQRSRWLELIVVIPVVAMLAACGGGGGSSPTEPPMPSAGLTITFTAQGAFGDQEDDIRRHIQETWERVAGQLNVSGVTAQVGTDQVIPGWGVGGRALNPTTFEIGVDPTLDNASLAAKLPSIVAHELHHIARMRGPGYGATLLEAMASEGLADHYAEELLGEPLPPWVTALSDDQYVFWLERARQEFDSTTYNHSHWFFGTGPMPNWTGYTIGFRLVSDYQDDNPGSTAASLVNQSANSFRPE